ncbi:DsbA family protein [Alkalilimnicola sp. S0819]|uniref:DsbA family protein n=1 Tax=Alkalilimnicola sp. S0819 TaxID=2613922 RepID=UPI0012625716|nr:thioredoxin domain-containing protein [Alkalilimnicola sp. S0819]KAB7627772.1 thioredoxin domain-containing protein [Alkalilimnicola sp. S0819]MPQ15397.1 thioredoxin domain-containing protein [Alkalilimnicola sp. S0819]
MGEAKRRQLQGEHKPRDKRGGKGGMIAVLVLVLLVVAAFLWWLSIPRVPPADELPRAEAGAGPFPAELDRHGISVGAADAPVVVREFADYQCPGCANFAPVAERLKNEYVDSGQVRFVFFELPLRQHANAVPAAHAARCAADQDAFWPMQQRLFDDQNDWSGRGNPVPRFAVYAGELGLDRDEFEACMESERHRSAINASLQVARQLGVSSTPTVVVDNIPLARPTWPRLKGVVDRELGAD